MYTQWLKWKIRAGGNVLSIFTFGPLLVAVDPLPCSEVGLLHVKYKKSFLLYVLHWCKFARNKLKTKQIDII